MHAYIYIYMKKKTGENWRTTIFYQKTGEPGKLWI